MYELKTEVNWTWMISRLNAAGVVLETIASPKPAEVEAALRLIRVVRDSARLAREMEQNGDEMELVLP